MDTLTFLANVIHSVAWPLVAAVALFVLRNPLVRLFGRLSSLKYGESEAKFGEDLVKLGEAAIEALPAPAVPASQPELSAPIAKLAETSPRAAVIEAWRDLSSAAMSALRQYSEQLPKVIPDTMVEDRLERRGLLNSQQVALLRQLRNLRNTAVHGPECRHEGLGTGP